MQYSSKVILKNNKPCLLRNCQAEDAQMIYDLFNLTHEQTDFLLTYPDQNSFDVEQERNFLIEKEDSSNEIEIAAFVDDKAVGSAGIEAIGNKEKMKHRAEIGISIEKTYWGLGIGRALMRACIDVARQAEYQQVELNVVSDNRSAIALYKSLGFVEYGRNPRGFRSRISGWQELVSMRLELDV